MRYSTTSAYSLTSLPARPGCSSTGLPTTAIQLLVGARTQASSAVRRLLNCIARVSATTPTPIHGPIVSSAACGRGKAHDFLSGRTTSFQALLMPHGRSIRRNAASHSVIKVSFVPSVPSLVHTRRPDLSVTRSGPTVLGENAHRRAQLVGSRKIVFHVVLPSNGSFPRYPDGPLEGRSLPFEGLLGTDTYVCFVAQE